MHACMHACIHTYIHTYTHTHTYITLHTIPSHSILDITIVQYKTKLHFTTFQFIALQRVTLYCIVLHCTTYIQIDAHWSVHTSPQPIHPIGPYPTSSNLSSSHPCNQIVPHHIQPNSIASCPLVGRKHTSSEYCSKVGCFLFVPQ